MEVAERIKANGATLTAAERRVAGASLAAPQAGGCGPGADLARAASVGAASVVRLAAKLGFDGYSDLQESIRRDLTHQLRPAAERIREGLGEGRADHLLAELSNIRASIESVDERSLADAAVRIADEGRSVVVVSGDATGGVAAQFVGQLQQLRSGVALVAGSEVAVRRDIALLDSSAVAVVIDLRRYERWVLETHEELRSRAIWTVGITDSLLSPIAMNADVSFVVSAGSVGPFDSHVGTLSVLNLLVGSVASQLRATAADRLAAIEAAWSATGGPGRAPALIEPDGSHPR
ncbi:MAG: MurR/RpiR family transcriptional regulator [Ilumatobacteraceae bacterium]